ncbi:membrane-bound PQQ-dependent dehydrogenase, glucose/quinate/shikimate family [uncultured Hydrogenophaga sp.]|uniref:membrane-bound PQQ-dependent dehydrogenase, glucose/quinate/shikimate family n=1 Tax=uncultured Hydrogenophaga sp. TaxID=199683 RepID=UPI00258289EE|nr:membrane-bound PQQ-dependent dehydrogenase, glucose/quinate/shikimate family [uncultured Hydrogenophaga sp.]
MPTAAPPHVPSPPPPPLTQHGLTLLLVVLLAVAALVLFAGGGWLLMLGGTPYYVLSGAALGFVALLLVQAQPTALWVYAGFVLATLLWSLWEVGLAWWGLAARGDVFFVLGLLMLLPAVARRLSHDPQVRGTASSMGWRGGRGALAGVLVLYLGVAVASWVVDPFATQGSLPGPRGSLAQGNGVPAGEWHAYGRTGHGQRYAPLAQITPENVGQLEEAWHFRTGDLRGQPGDPQETTFEVTPLKVGDHLFLCTPHQQVIALDATTGEELWRFDPKIRSGLALQHLTCRGLSYWSGQGASAAESVAPATPGEAPVAVGGKPPAAPALSGPELPIAAQDSPATDNCPAMLYMPTADGRVIALDPRSGEVCRSFGEGTGQINLWRGMPNVKLGGYYSTSPVVATQRVLVVGGTVLDNVSVNEPSGVVRGYDVRTGALLWAWDPARPDDQTPLQPGQTYSASSPNVWSIMSVDEALGLVYLPLGNPPPDQWGGKRSPQVERVGSSVVALDLATGRLRWVFQTVHHDLWDYDVPSQPTLVDLNIQGASVPALVQPTKQGELFVLDRRTGKPVHPVREVPVPQGAAEGDRTAPTQPVSSISFEPEPLHGAAMWGATPFDQLGCRIALKRLRYEGRYTPPSTEGSLVYPGNFGVFNWGGIAVDPVRQVAFTTPAYLAFTSQLVPRPDDTALMVQGDNQPKDDLPALNENFGAPFAVKMGAFTSPLGLPCQAPPWGYVAGVDLVSGEVVWQHRNGTVRDLAPVPLPFKMGVPSLGGPLITQGGVAFLSGTLDDYLRAYDLSTGETLWQSRLPAGGQATPMSYQGRDGRQYVVVAAGGHGSLGTKAGDSVIAYALPK